MERQRRTAIGLWAAGAVLIAGIALTGAFGVRVNMTPSYPLGLWRIVQKGTAYQNGDRVFICPPQAAVFAMALERAYLPRGLCLGGSGPLIKTIAALPGQRVDIGAQVSIDARVVPNTLLRAFDAKGRPLQAAPGGAVPDGQVFLLSTYAGSFDSRYFGPIPASGILGLAEPVLTYAR